MGKKLEGETSGRADPNWTKRYSMLCNILLSSKTGLEEEGGGGALASKADDAQRLARHQCAGGW